MELLQLLLLLAIIMSMWLLMYFPSINKPSTCVGKGVLLLLYVASFSLIGIAGSFFTQPGQRGITIFTVAMRIFIGTLVIGCFWLMRKCYRRRSVKLYYIASSMCWILIGFSIANTSGEMRLADYAAIVLFGTTVGVGSGCWLWSLGIFADAATSESPGEKIVATDPHKMAPR